MPFISVVSPVYNEQECLPELLRQLDLVLSAIDPDYEIVLVDDGSRDRSWALIEQAHARDARVRGLRFSRNFGHHLAIAAGLDHAEGQWVVVMDSDLQDPPEAIAQMLALARAEGADVVVARRLARQHGPIKTMLSRAFHATLSYLMGARSDSREGVFRLMRRPVVLALRQTRELARFFTALADWVGFRKVHFDVQHGKRYAGETKYSLRKQISLAATAILSFSDKPLKLAVAFGMGVALAGMLYAAVIIVRALMGGIVVQGYASLFSAVLIVGGAGIMTTGLVGLYVGRIFQQVKNRPLYILAESHCEIGPPTRMTP